MVTYMEKNKPSQKSHLLAIGGFSHIKIIISCQFKGSPGQRPRARLLADHHTALYGRFDRYFDGDTHLRHSKHLLTVIPPFRISGPSGIGRRGGMVESKSSMVKDRPTRR